MNPTPRRSAAVSEIVVKRIPVAGPGSLNPRRGNRSFQRAGQDSWMKISVFDPAKPASEGSIAGDRVNLLHRDAPQWGRFALGFFGG